MSQKPVHPALFLANPALATPWPALNSNLVSCAKLGALKPSWLIDSNSPFPGRP